jgi:hypothetical protein
MRNNVKALVVGPKTIDELLNQIVDDIERAERGEPAGLF